MDIEKLNKKHFVEADMYYRVGKGLSSRLTAYRNAIIYLEITVSEKWKGDYNSTASEIAQLWKKSHRELKDALGCKVFFRMNEKQSADCDKDYSAKKGILYSKNHLN